MVLVKRGVFVLVLVVFLMFLPVVIAVSNSDSEIGCAGNGIRCEGLQLKDDDGENFDKHYNHEAEYCDGCNEAEAKSVGWGWSNEHYCEGWEGDYDDRPKFSDFSSADKGCFLAAVDLDEGIDDDSCVYTFVPVGEQIANLQAEAKKLATLSDPIEWGDDDKEEGANILKWPIYISPGGICANDHYWYTCGSINTYKGEDVSKIKVETKADGKTITDQLNLARLGALNLTVNGVNELYYCINTISDQYKWLTMDERLSQPLQDKDHDGVPIPEDCDDTNPAIYPSFGDKRAVAICGDGKLNTCGEVVNENDDCNADPEACNAQGMHHVSNVVDGNGYCCGSGGISDLGKLSTDKSKVCLSNNNLVRAENKDEIFNDESCAGKQWCWVPAFTEFFNIITVDKFTETYDLVSNGEKWSECKESADKGVLDQPEIKLKAKSKQFQCYDEGNHFSWARCVPTGEEVFGIKARSAGQGLFLIAASSTANNEHLLESSSFASHYGDDHLWDFSGYDYLELDVKFAAGLELPLDLNLKIYGDTGDKIYFDSNVLGYANSSIVAGEYIHLKIPIQNNLKGIKTLIFGATGDNKVELKNVYLTKENNNLFCSGATTSRESNWLGSLDKEGKIFNVEYEVEFDYDAKEWSYPEKSFGWKLISHALFETPLNNDGNEILEERDVKISFASSPLVWGPFIMKVTISDADPSFNHYLMQKFDDTENKISLKPYYFDGEKLAEINLNEPYEYRIFSFDLTNMEMGKYDLYLKAEYTAEDNGIVIDKPSKKTETFTPVCLVNEAKKECLFAIPGLPEEGFTIENKHPYLYDLYFIDKEEKESLISDDNKKFTGPGNIIARKVPDQVLAAKDENEDDVFYGCSAAKYILDQKEGIAKLDRCAIKEKKICSVDDNGRLNSWNETKFETAHFSSILPGKNLLSNAEFSTQGGKITYWQLFDKDGKEITRNFNAYLEENDDSPAGKVLKLSRNELLISERIAVPALTQMHFSDSADGCGEVYVIDQDGQAVKQEENIFTTPENVLAVQVKFVGKGIIGIGSCKVSQPSLQILDGTPAPYNSVESTRISGASCCAPASCWNGQACVEDMSAHPQLKEQSGDKSYRCINGSWQNAVIKKDWNQDKEGYCVTEQQCFVSSQTITLDKEYPVCINDQQYVLDHHCSKGNWTSRTKYVAEQLLTLLDSGDDYSLYCDTFRNVLSEYEKVIVHGVVSNAPFNDNTCFQHPGQGPASYEENTCFNNVCVLVYSDGSKTKTAFGATLNKPVNGLLFPALGTNGECPENTAGFEPCSDAYGRKIFYSSKLNAVIYAEDAPRQEPSLLERISGFFRNFFGLSNSLAEQESFLQQAQNFRELFLLSKDEKSVSAIKESARRMVEARTDDQGRIIAEYKNFQSPVCDYLNQQRIDFFRVPFAEDQISCAKTAGLQRVEINSSKEGTDILWPQMTAKLRVE